LSFWTIFGCGLFRRVFSSTNNVFYLHWLIIFLNVFPKLVSWHFITFIFFLDYLFMCMLLLLWFHINLFIVVMTISNLSWYIGTLVFFMMASNRSLVLSIILAKISNLLVTTLVQRGFVLYLEPHFFNFIFLIRLL
jgi:hypothetical protein